MESRKEYRFDAVAISYDQLVYKIGSYHYNWHDEIEILWLLTGKIEVNVDGETFSLEQDDLIVINSNSGHATFATVPDSIAMRLYISPNFFSSQGFDLSKGRFEMNASQERMNPQFASLRKDLAKLQLLSADNFSNQLSHNALLFRIAEKLLNFFVVNEKKSKGYTVGQKRNFLDQAIQYIEENFKMELTLELLAQQCNYSTSYLSKIFKTELGINFYEYLTRCRLQHAVRALTMTEDKIASIAYDNGFSDVKAFNKMFKKHFGMTPSEYRKQVSPDLQEIDRTFKVDLDEAERAAIEAQLLNYQDPQQVTSNNPCLVCMSKDYEQKYEELVSNIRKMVQ
ncbi:AraC family transcriptional regulator [Enterococcus sp. AZ109]|uniref:AraC family transcriptional regulator n=1 Tax=Enterococcus sp. AZ109 TaxID=2774634 RepID=UPI003F1E66DE